MSINTLSSQSIIPEPKKQRNNWFVPKSPNQDTAFRERTIRILVFGIVLLTLMGVGISVFLFHDPIEPLSLPSLYFLAIGLGLASAFAVSRQRIAIAGWLLIVM